MVLKGQEDGAGRSLHGVVLREVAMPHLRLAARNAMEPSGLSKASAPQHSILKERLLQPLDGWGLQG